MTDKQIFDAIASMINKGEIKCAYLTDDGDIGYMGETDKIEVEIIVKVKNPSPPVRDNHDMCEARYLRVA